jgi:RNA recognition motif-containing protein
MNNNKLFVGNLSYDLDDAALEKAFSQVGQVVSATIIMDKRTNRSKGFGFVEMSSAAEAEEAIKTLNGQEVGGRAMSVSEARPPKPRF